MIGDTNLNTPIVYIPKAEKYWAFNKSGIIGTSNEFLNSPEFVEGIKKASARIMADIEAEIIRGAFPIHFPQDYRYSMNKRMLEVL